MNAYFWSSAWLITATAPTTPNAIHELTSSVRTATAVGERQALHEARTQGQSQGDSAPTLPVTLLPHTTLETGDRLGTSPRFPITSTSARVRNACFVDWILSTAAVAHNQSGDARVAIDRQTRLVRSTSGTEQGHPYRM